MAAVEVTITGMLYDKTARTSQSVVLVGEASLTGLEVGGGPMPGGPGQRPPLGIWGGGGVPMPTPPIYIPSPPDPPEVPPGTPPNTVIKEAPEGGWGYFTNSQGAVYSAYNPGAAGPKR